MFNEDLWEAHKKESSEQRWEKRKQWRVRNNLDDGQIKRFAGPDDAPIESINDVLLMLSCGWEFYVKFQDEEYFITPNPWYSISDSWDDTLYESLDLDDFGENARIGEDGEFLLKDVANEVELA